MASEGMEIDGPFGELDEPGPFAGFCTLIGALIGGAVIAYLYYYGPQDFGLATWHPAVVIGIGLVYVLLAAAFTFLIGWMLEVAWPLLASMIVFGLLLSVLIFYYGVEKYFRLIFSKINSLRALGELQG